MVRRLAFLAKIKNPDKVQTYYQNALTKGITEGIQELLGYFPSDSECKGIRVDIKNTNMALIAWLVQHIAGAAKTIRENAKVGEKAEFWQAVQTSEKYTAAFFGDGLNGRRSCN